MRHRESTSRRRFIRTSSLWLSAAAGMAATQESKVAGKPVARLGLLTDLHYAEKAPGGTRHYRESADKLAEAVDLFQQEKVDAVIELGDLVDAAPTVEEETRFLKTINARLKQLDCPRHYVLGNHCVATLTKAQFLKACDANPKGYYSWDLGGIHVIILDACYRHDFQSYEPGNFEWTDPNIPTEEADWLTKDLANTEHPTVVFVHQRLDLDPATSPYAIKQSPAIRKVLESSGKVRAVFQGHSHQNALTDINGIAYTTLVAMVEGSGQENNAYSILNVYADGSLALTGYRKQRSQSFPKAS